MRSLISACWFTKLDVRAALQLLRVAEETSTLRPSDLDLEAGQWPLRMAGMSLWLGRSARNFPAIYQWCAGGRFGRLRYGVHIWMTS